MPKYDATDYDPPAPVVEVTLRHPDTGRSLPGVSMLIDTGADITLLPAAAALGLGVEPLAGHMHQMQGFDGTASTAPIAVLDVLFLNRIYRGKYVLIEAPHGILGRDLLAHVTLRIDGPRQEWSQVLE